MTTPTAEEIDAAYSDAVELPCECAEREFGCRHCSAWERARGKVNRIETELTEAKAMIAELGRSLAANEDASSNAGYRLCALESERDSLLARIAELEKDSAEYIAQTDPFLSCGTADDPAAGRCGNCRGCLLEKVAEYRQAVAAATKESKR